MIKNKIILAVSLFMIVMSLAVVFPQPAMGAAADQTPGGGAAPAPSSPNLDKNKCKKNFFGLKPWYAYMDNEFAFVENSPADRAANRADPCSVKCFNLFNRPANEPNECGQTRSDLPAILLAVIDDLLRIAGIVAVAFVIVGSFQFVTSQGNPEQTTKARSTLINALIGAAIAMVAIGFVSFVGASLGGN